jgi:hypothetical protein
LLRLIEAKDITSQRVPAFTKHLGQASGFLPMGDLTSLGQYKKAELWDDSRRFVPDAAGTETATLASGQISW